MDFVAALFIAPLVFLCGYMITYSAVIHEWGIFVAAFFAGVFTCVFEVVVIRDAINSYGEKEN